MKNRLHVEVDYNLRRRMDPKRRHSESKKASNPATGLSTAEGPHGLRPR